MSRYRKIECKIWADDKFPFLSMQEKLVFLHLLTTPLSTPFGLFRAGAGALAEELGMSLNSYKNGIENGYREALEELSNRQMVVYDEKYRVIFLKNFLRHNPPENPNVLQSWVTPFDEIPHCALKYEFFIKLKKVIVDRQKEKVGENLREDEKKRSFQEVFAQYWSPLEKYLLPFAKPYQECSLSATDCFNNSTNNGSINSNPNQEQEQEQEQEQKQEKEKMSTDTVTEPNLIEAPLSSVKQLKLQEWQQQAEEVLLFLNEKTGRRYRPQGANLKLIIARLKSGVSVQECRQVIAKKVREWSVNPDMEIYLRPKTLFSATNFEQYLGELVFQKEGKENEKINILS